MVDRVPQDMAEKLMAKGFSRSGPVAGSLSDPIADTVIVVTQDELRPYELDPRITRNPIYKEIKDSIKQRGMDAPLSITRRPGADHYIICSGGNTRLAILRELWLETKEDRFFRLMCVYRPWPERGEIIALTGHLAENELHGRLTFIERALGVDKAREIYEQEEIGKSISQSELARRLSADGYPIQQSHISRMQETIRYLLPAIPTLLYAGLGRHQVERLVVLRKAAEFAWQKYASQKNLNVEFDAVFQDTLTTFDTNIENFVIKRVQDELMWQMASVLEVDYNILELDIDSIEHRQHLIITPPKTQTDSPTNSVPLVSSTEYTTTPASPQIFNPSNPTITKANTSDLNAQLPKQSVQERTSSKTDATRTPDQNNENNEWIEGHIVSPAPSTDRLQAIQQLVAEHTGEQTQGFADNALRAIPVQAGGLFPISDVWYIDPSLDSPDRLRIHIAQFAREIADEAQLADCIHIANTGIGFICILEKCRPLSLFSRTVMALLHALSASHDIELPRPDTLEDFLLDEGIGVLLLGSGSAHTLARLSDVGLVKLFRLVRLARRLRDLETCLHDKTEN